MAPPLHRWRPALQPRFMHLPGMQHPRHSCHRRPRQETCLRKPRVSAGGKNPVQYADDPMRTVLGAELVGKMIVWGELRWYPLTRCQGLRQRGSQEGMWR